MKFYKIDKEALKFTDMPQVDYKWDLPILIDNDYNVIAGNCLRDKLIGQVLVIIINNEDREVLFDSIKFIEQKIAEENSVDRLNAIYTDFHTFFREVRKPVYEQGNLFEFKDTGLVTEENYIEPPAYNFEKHNTSKKNGETEEFEIDVEMLKELL